MDSIMQDNRECYITGATTELNQHHIWMGNPLRQISDDNGFWVWLRWDWHTGADYCVHKNRDFDLRLKRECQEKFEETHTREEFMKIIGRNYL